MGLARPINRYDQLAELYDGLTSRYANLQIANASIKQEMIEFKTKATYWEEQFNRLKTREEELKTENEELKAQLKKREQQLFGKKSEKINGKLDQHSSQAKSDKKKRGQQPGSKGHGRRDYNHLPVLEEQTIDLKPQYKRCACVGYLTRNCQAQKIPKY